MTLDRPLENIQRDATISAATTITPASGASVVVLQPLTQDIYVTLNGETPSTTSGFKIGAGSVYTIDVTSDTVIKVIEATASAEVRWQSFGLFYKD